MLGGRNLSSLDALLGLAFVFSYEVQVLSPSDLFMLYEAPEEKVKGTT